MWNLQSKCIPEKSITGSRDGSKICWKTDEETDVRFQLTAKCIPEKSITGSRDEQKTASKTDTEVPRIRSQIVGVVRRLNLRLRKFGSWDKSIVKCDANPIFNFEPTGHREKKLSEISLCNPSTAHHVFKMVGVSIWDAELHI